MSETEDRASSKDSVDDVVRIQARPFAGSYSKQEDSECDKRGCFDYLSSTVKITPTTSYHLDYDKASEIDSDENYIKLPRNGKGSERESTFQGVQMGTFSRRTVPIDDDGFETDIDSDSDSRDLHQRLYARSDRRRHQNYYIPMTREFCDDYENISSSPFSFEKGQRAYKERSGSSLRDVDEQINFPKHSIFSPYIGSTRRKYVKIEKKKYQHGGYGSDPPFGQGLYELNKVGSSIGKLMSSTKHKVEGMPEGRPIAQSLGLAAEDEKKQKKKNKENKIGSKDIEEKTSLQKNSSFDKTLEQLRKNGEAGIRIQRLIDSINIEQTYPQQYHKDQTKTTEYENIIQRVDYLDCSGLDFSNAEKQMKDFEPFSEFHVEDFFSWMMGCDEVLQKTQSAKCRAILSTLFAAYTKAAIIEFKPKIISLITDRCMDYAIENKNHILVLELVKSYMFNVDFNLQKRFEGKKINSVVKDTLLQAAKYVILRKCPRLQQNSISLSFCYECKLESRLVMMMSYKGIIEMKDGIPEKAMGVNLVLYNYTQPSDEAYTVFNSTEASSAIKLPVIAEREARKLFIRHSNLTLISASPFKSTGYSKGKHKVVRKPCISLLCLHKGYIPFGEKEFPKQINGFDVDVQEGYCSFGSGRSIDFGGHIRRARGINTPGNGSIGGFVDLSNDAVGLITCAHVVFSSDELKISNAYIDKYVLDNDTDLEVEVFDKSQHKFQVCGSIVDKCFPYLSNENSVDAALIQLDPTVNEFEFPVTDQLYSAGFDPNKPPRFTGEVVNVPDPDPIYKLSSRIPGKSDSVVKYGSKTKFTIGNLYINGVHIRFVDDTGNLPDNTIAVMCNQIEIQSLPHGTFFEPGDSGAFVFCINPEKTLSCLGMAIGSTTKGSCFVTPMTRILDSFRLPHILKPGPLLSSENIARASENPLSAQISQQNNASSELSLEAILLQMQLSITDIQNRQTNFQSSLNSVQKDVGKLRKEVQAEVGNLRRQVGYLKSQVKEMKRGLQTRTSGASLDINQN
ncbi:uncharacterized protein LOC134277689 [Saccostrea cucullata]|uniref:uncharacterized protein LOC134277689 n=1 Tax=Saccostrea cuccullata TaxID=36930 RepID=UPI002ED6A474